jgi:hypothetical protein
MHPLAKFSLFVVTAGVEIVGCYLVYLWTRGGRSALYLLGAAFALALFAWLLSFHPNAGRAMRLMGECTLPVPSRRAGWWTVNGPIGGISSGLPSLSWV